EAALDGIRDELRVRVVEVGLEQADDPDRGAVLRRPDENTNDVRTFRWVGGAGSVTDVFERQRRKWAERLCEDGDQSGARRCHRLQVALDADESRAAKELGGRRGRKRQRAVDP